jgi:hypothetical protein
MECLISIIQVIMMIHSSAVISTHLESSPGHIMTTVHSAVVVGPESRAHGSTNNRIYAEDDYRTSTNQPERNNQQDSITSMDLNDLQDLQFLYSSVSGLCTNRWEFKHLN